MNAHRSAADFPTVEHHVVGFCQSLAWLALEEDFVPIHGARERMMQGVPAFFLFIPVEHRKVDHPQWTPRAVRITLLVSNLRTQSTEGIVDNLGFVRAKENQIAILRTGSLNYGVQCLIRKVLDDGRLKACAPFGCLVDLDIGQTLGAIDRHEFGIAVDLATRQRAAAWNQQTRDPAVR